MGMLQIKNFPDELKQKLAARAKAQGTTMSALVIDMVWADLSMPTTAEWVAQRRAGIENEPIVDTSWALQEARDEFESTGRYV